MKMRQFAFFIVLMLLGLLLVRNFGKIPEFIELLKSLNIWILLLIFPARYGYYWSSTRYYQHFFALFNKRLKYKELFPGVINMNFLNTVVPSGGLSGAAYFARQYESKITGRQSYLAQFFWYIATAVSLVTVLAGSFLVLFFSNSIIQVSFRLTLIFISVLLALAIVAIVVTLNPFLFKKLLFILTRPANWILKLVKRDMLNETHINRFVDSYHDLITMFSKHPRRAIRPLLDAFLCIVFEMASIFVIFLAFGEFVNPGIIGGAYVLALIASALSVFTAGVGVYEATMVAIFVALGVSFGLAFSVTTVYRLIAFWLFIPVGLYFYKRHALDEED